jgi:hypothetical protein
VSEAFVEAFMQVLRLLALCSAMLLAGCTFYTTDTILAPIAGNGWVQNTPPAYTGWKPYVEIKAQGVKVDAQPPLLHGRTWVGPGYFPIIPVSDARDALQVSIDISGEAPVTVDPRAFSLTPPCGPGAQQNGEEIVFERSAVLYDMRSRIGTPPKTPVGDFPVTVQPGFILSVALTVRAKPDDFQTCTVRFGDDAVTAPHLSLPPLTYRRDRFRQLDWD